MVHYLILIIEKNNFSILGEGNAFDINGSFGTPEKEFSINFSKTNTKYNKTCITMVIKVICLLMEKKYISLKLIIEISGEVFLKRNVYDFSVDYNTIQYKSDNLNFHKY